MHSDLGDKLDQQSECNHTWVRLRRLEEELTIVVFVKACTQCDRLEAKAGHKDRNDDDGCVLIGPENGPVEG
jgi:hypothetical protein